MAKNSIARGLRITPKGYAILALLDRGEYKPITTMEAKILGGRRGLRKIRRMRKNTGVTVTASTRERQGAPHL